MTRRPAAGLIEIAARCRHLLLDFDDPVCAVFAGTPAPAVARELRLALSADGIPLPAEALNTGDPLEVFRITARHHPEAAELARAAVAARQGGRRAGCRGTARSSRSSPGSGAGSWRLRGNGEA